MSSLHIVLFEPEIPPNAGAVGRLCVNIGAPLHLIHPLGFSLDERAVKKAGLDYWHKVDLREHRSWDDYLASVGESRFWIATPKAERLAWDVEFQEGDHLVFGRESSGFSEGIEEQHAERCIALPMPGPEARTLNLACSVSAITYEALRQLRT